MYKKIVVMGIISIFLLTNLTTLSSARNNIDTENKLQINGEYFDSESLNIGDLLFCDINTEVLTYMREVAPGYSNDHSAMYIGNDRFIHAIPSMLFVSLPSGVCIWSLSEIETYFTNIVFAHVTTASESDRLNAVEWAKDRLGRPYQYRQWVKSANCNPYDPDDKYSDRWYCSEIIWAAYYNQNNQKIDLCKNNWTYGGRVYVSHILGDDELETHSNIPPNANIYVRLYTDPDNNKIVHFSTFGSRNPDGKPPDFRWDFENDGIWDTDWISLNWSGLDYEYELFSTYTVRVQVRDDMNAIDETTETFAIEEEPVSKKPLNKPLTSLLKFFQILTNFIPNIY
jgi:uncharacterized protein YycO